MKPNSLFYCLQQMVKERMARPLPKDKKLEERVREVEERLKLSRMKN